MKDRIIGACELYGSKGTKKICFLRAQAENSMATEKGLMSIIYNEILNSQGLSKLHGFGYAKCETTEGRKKVTSRYFMNAERDSIRKPI